MSKLTKEALVCIKKTFNRFLSILAIVLLGVGFYSGIQAVAPDMKKSLNKYYQEKNVYDLIVTSNYGLSKDNIQKLEDEGYSIEEEQTIDTIVKKDEEYAIKVFSYDKDNKINKLKLIKGKLPTKNNECVIENNKASKIYKIGDSIKIEETDLKETELKIVGIVESPLYISGDRDNTTLLSGKINFNIFVPLTNFNNEIYKDAYIDLKIDDNVFTRRYDKKISKQKKQLKETLKTIEFDNYNKIKDELDKNIKSLQDTSSKITTSYDSIKDNPYVPQTEKNKLQENLNKVNDSIKDLEEKKSSLEKPKWYVLDLSSNVGFYQYREDSNRIKNVASVFPMAFFIIAILVCLTTMTRMVDEERGQIGTLKSLGYKDKEIMFKYIIYALLATLIGSLIGSILGSSILPNIIFKMYATAYSIDFNNYLYVDKIILGTVIALICTVGATYYSCIKTLKEVPAALLRPKAPEAGKRVLLERIPFIWKRLSFSRKVAVRNSFRYKKRFLMTILGILGSTSLILGGLGLRECISSLVPIQYGDIFDYQVAITLNDSKLATKNEDFKNISKLKDVKKSLKVEQETVKLPDHKTNQTIAMIVPFGDIDDFIKLRNRKGHEKLPLKDDVIVSEKIAKLLSLKKGDKLNIKGSKNYSTKIGGITENYLFHYIYMPKKKYNSDEYNTIYLKTTKMTEKEEKDFANIIKQYPSVSSLSFIDSSRTWLDDTMKNFSSVAIVLIISAGLLAFVVLYNLANVNIGERKRELASHKVLGFHDKEVYRYLSRETVILTVIGIALGLGGGTLLTAYVMKTCEQDILMFNVKISLMGYVTAIALTVFFTFIVNIMVYFTVKKINMIESLKSAE